MHVIDPLYLNCRTYERKMAKFSSKALWLDLKYNKTQISSKFFIAE